MENTSETVKKIIDRELLEKESLEFFKELDDLEKSFERLNIGIKNNKGYTIPQVDTIGIHLYGKVFCQIKA